MQRSLIEACAKIIGNSFDSAVGLPDELLDQSEQAVFSISKRTAGNGFRQDGNSWKKVFENLSALRMPAT